MEQSDFAILIAKLFVIILMSQAETVIGLQFFMNLLSLPALGMIVIQDLVCDGARVPVDRRLREC